MSEKKLPPIEARAIRTKEAGTFERLLCQLLIRANASDGLKKIELMCQAYYRSKPLLPENPVQINESEVDVMHKVVVALRYATRYSMGSNREYIHVAWPFLPTKENFDKYIAEWYKQDSLQYYPYIGGWRWPSELEEMEQKYVGTLNEAPAHLYFFCVTMGLERYGLKLSETGYDRLCSQVISWCVPKVEEWYVELTKLVDPSLFDEIFRTMYMAEKKPEKEE